MPLSRSATTQEAAVRHAEKCQRLCPCRCFIYDDLLLRVTNTRRRTAKCSSSGHALTELPGKIIRDGRRTQFYAVYRNGHFCATQQKLFRRYITAATSGNTICSNSCPYIKSVLFCLHAQMNRCDTGQWSSIRRSVHVAGDIRQDVRFIARSRGATAMLHIGHGARRFTTDILRAA